jgi:hypothetical protein
VSSFGELRTSQRGWRDLPRTRRRALEVRGASPDGAEEARALIARGRYLRSWLGAAEWVVGGAIGVAVATGLQYLLTGEFPWSPAQPVAFAAVFGLVGVGLRQWRGRQLVERGQAVLDADDPGREFGPSGADG